jgi:hypothetical protein
MSIIHVNHIKSNCQQRFTGLIEMADVQKLQPGDQENHFLSRSLAAFSIASSARIDDITAARSVVDESKDDGIDAFYFDRSEHVCYLAQSKWVKDGNDSVDSASTLKFTQGIKHFLESKIELLGPKLQAKDQDIQDVLADSQATFVLIVCYTGKPQLSPEAKMPLDELLSSLNDDGEFVSLQVLRQEELHRIVEQSALGESVDLTIMLHEWGKVREPYTAYYGQANVSDIRSWGKFGNHLYIKNIRGYKGSTDVNDAIIETIKDKAENFLYFNNGITLLCAEIGKQPLGGDSRESGVFDCKGASVVNGAQTVGSIISSLSASTGPQPNARVMVKIISLKGCPEDFGSEVTRATNTQNRIEKRDFAALDPEQARLKTEMLLSLQKEYSYKTGDQPPAEDKGCTLDEATVSLACARPEISYCMVAKTQVSKLYEDVSQAPYKVLFNSSLSAPKLWRAVEVMRKVDLCLKQQKSSGKERLYAVHGNRLVLHLVFRALGDALFDAAYPESETKKISDLVPQFLSKIGTKIAKDYPQSYPAVLFKNTTKCTAIAAEAI